MYAIVHKNNVVLTQRSWNTRMMTGVLLDTCGVNRRLLLSDELDVPISINENTRIVRVEDNQPFYNTRTQRLDGPIITILEDKVVYDYEIKPLDLNIAKGNLVSGLSETRKAKEVQFKKVTVKNKIYPIKTDKDTRYDIMHKLLSIGNNSKVNWKFKDGWEQLSKQDLESMLAQLDSHIQDGYDWELSKTNEINACKTHEDLDKVDVT